MDTISTAIGGALLGKALPEKHRGPNGVWVVTLASALPDADIFTDLVTNDPLGDLTQHRAFTHSLLGAVILAPLLALAFWRFSKGRHYPRLLLLAFLGLAWHMFADLATSWGTQVFYPFNRDRIVWDLLFIVDFAFTAILILPQATAWVYGEPRGAVRRGVLVWAVLTAFTALVISYLSPFLGAAFNWPWLGLLSALLVGLLVLPAIGGWGFRHERAAFCRVGLAVLAIYLGVCTIAHFQALRQVEHVATEKKLAAQSVEAVPQPLSPFRWSGLVLTSAGVYQAWLNLLDSRPPEFQFFPTAENGFVSRAQALPQVQTYLWFARFPVARYRTELGHHIVEYGDLRFRRPQDRNPGFLFRIVFNARGEMLSCGFVER